ncbi:MAG: hypothetical protein ACJAUP_002711 [Cellvibrionaceae bacterium]|jgi:hypothetical protein
MLTPSVLPISFSYPLRYGVGYIRINNHFPEKSDSQIFKIDASRGFIDIPSARLSQASLMQRRWRAVLFDLSVALLI